MNTKDHQNEIDKLLQYINRCSDDYILKGGTSLRRCYQSTRRSKDIDLDSGNKNAISKIIKEYCQMNGYSYRIAKDTDTVKRYLINYGDATEPIKVEISFRNKYRSKEEAIKVDGICVYPIARIAEMKLNAYNSRDKLRDIYDIIFLTKNYWDIFPEHLKNSIIDSLCYKNIESLDYIVETQKNDPDNQDINIEQLENDFLEMLENIGVEIDMEYREI